MLAELDPKQDKPPQQRNNWSIPEPGKPTPGQADKQAAEDPGEAAAVAEAKTRKINPINLHSLKLAVVALGIKVTATAQSVIR